MGKRFIIYCILLVLGMGGSSYAQERVFVSTDKNSYIVGEDIWISLYCTTGDTKEYSQESSVAYLEFHSAQGVEHTLKLALIEGRGCGRLQIPFNFATGNYSIVAYTRKNGGKSKDKFNGKTISVFNTITDEKVKGGTRVVKKPEYENKGIQTQASESPVRFKIDVKGGSETGGNIDINVRSLYMSGTHANFNISLYHLDEIEKYAERQGIGQVPLTARTGTLSPTGVTEYAGEIIRVKVTPSEEANMNMNGKFLYMSAKGNEDDLYVGALDSLGYVTYYTNNMSGDKELLFEVVDDVTMTSRTSSKAGSISRYNVNIVEDNHIHTPDSIPVLQIFPQLKDALEERNIRMQISRRFEADSLFNLMEMRSASYLGGATHTIYNLDDYTRFPTMEDVVREYVTHLRIRKMNGVTSLRVVNDDVKEFVWVAKSPALALLDGVPVRDHEILVNLNPLLVKQIIVYPRQFILNHFVFDGVVKFNTYKGDMGGIKIEDMYEIIPHKGVQYPLAFLTDGIMDNVRYPNYNSTLYWNPIVKLDNGETFRFTVARPKYSGEFKLRIEGIDGEGKSIFHEETITL